MCIRDRTDNVKKDFEKALEYIKNSSSTGLEMTNKHKLLFYALFKQATDGQCTGPSPSRLKVVEKAKYDAWKGLGSISKEEAMKRYIAELTLIQPNWKVPTPKL
eukprot:TRINITY_DN2635_c0_g1_i2.p1 TRINITY_DN2635_c0_g1~~TRINITY_DN2635_c0_g1_i2.p1  ORF type:complete len:104 (-),score=28.43 TRINITY_DN2635_c0_g1_i2:182-493(-)